MDTVTRRATLAVLLAAATGCGGNPAPEAPAPEPSPDVRPYFLLAVGAKPDSAVELARFALAEIGGKVNLPQVRPKVITISSHYVRDRRGGGHREVAVIAAIDRQGGDGASPLTTIEVAAWAIDMAQQTTQRRIGPQVPSTALSTNAPATRQPRQITPRDTTDWQILETVVASFVARGARLKP